MARRLKASAFDFALAVDSFIDYCKDTGTIPSDYMHRALTAHGLIYHIAHWIVYMVMGGTEDLVTVIGRE